MNMQNITVVRQLVREHEASLRPAAVFDVAPRRSQLRLWVGRQLVRTGFWLAYEQPMRPAAAR